MDISSLLKAILGPSIVFHKQMWLWALCFRFGR